MIIDQFLRSSCLCFLFLQPSMIQLSLISSPLLMSLKALSSPVVSLPQVRSMNTLGLQEWLIRAQQRNMEPVSCPAPENMALLLNFDKTSFKCLSKSEPTALSATAEPLYSCSLSKQALRNSCELLIQRKELHASSCNCMQGHRTACKVMELHASSCKCMQAHVTACKLM